MWTPISLPDLNELISESLPDLDAMQLRLWEMIKIAPEKWRQDPWGNEGGGFWVVGLMGSTVIYYNDIEDGFNTSPFSQYGTIDEYYCQEGASIQPVMYDLAMWLRGGTIATGRWGPPTDLPDATNGR